MNGETIHDALNLLPNDLLTPVDALRTSPRRPRARAWMLPLAACLALCLSFLILPMVAGRGGSSAPKAEDKVECMAEAPAAAAPDLPAEAPAFDTEPPAFHSLTTILAEPALGTDVNAAVTGEEAGGTVETPSTGIANLDLSPQAMLACDREALEFYRNNWRHLYDLSGLDAWENTDFETQDLLVLRYWGSAPAGWALEETDGGWQLLLRGMEWGDTCRHLVIPVEKGSIHTDASLALQLEE